MGNSLQDQLLRAGLANKKQGVKARKALNNKQKLKASGKAVDDEAAQRVKAAAEEKAEKDRQLNREKQQQLEARAIQAQIIQLIELNRLEERGDVEFSYTAESVIRTIMVTPRQQKGLVNGQLALVRAGSQEHSERVELVSAKVVEKIAERDSTAIVLHNQRDEEEPIDDEYADYQVPDDLMW